jgi:serine/threonine-protein kinase
LGLLGLTLIFASISTVLLLPKLTNRQTDNRPNPEVTTTATSPSPENLSPENSSPENVSPTPEPTIPDVTETIAPAPSIIKTNPDTPSFGAIARSPSTQSKGYSWNYPSRQAAETRALNECEKLSNTGDCKILIWAKNACMSIAEGTNGAAGSGWSEKLAIAENTAQQVCQNYQGINCTITRTVCLPVR